MIDKSIRPAIRSPLTRQDSTKTVRHTLRKKDLFLSFHFYNVLKHLKVFRDQCISAKFGPLREPIRISFFAFHDV